MDQDKLWEFQQTERPESFCASRARLDWIASQLRPGERVLDIGVGGGIFEEIALARGVEVYAVDPSEKTIANLRVRLGLAERAQVGRGESLPFPDGLFQAVIVSEVLEHLPDDVLGTTLGEIQRVLSRGGRIIGTVPFQENLEEQNVICPDCGRLFHRWGHVHSFSDIAIRELLAPHFVTPRTEVRLFITWSTLNWKGKLVALAKRFLFALGIHGRDESLVFIGTRR